MNLVMGRLLRQGPIRVGKLLLRRCGRTYHRLRTHSAAEYRAPSDPELLEIEHRCTELGMPSSGITVDPDEFAHFVDIAGFPLDYHGGQCRGVYREKLLEHFVAWKLLQLADSKHVPYLDVAACSSPWAKLLRDRGIEAFAIDLEVPAEYANFGYYRQEDATCTTFPDMSIGGASLQCAYEMFMGEDDIGCLKESARILKPGGRIVISPLYMHVFPCYYQTPEYYGTPLGDVGAKGFIRRSSWGVPASRKYSPETLRSRVWLKALEFGLIPSLRVLRNKHQIGPEIYLHFILVLDKPMTNDLHMVVAEL